MVSYIVNLYWMVTIMVYKNLSLKNSISRCRVIMSA